MSATATVSEILAITGWPARAFYALVAGVHLYVALTTIDQVAHPGLTIAGLVVFVALTFWLTVPRLDRRVWFAVVACLAFTVLVDGNLTLDNFDTFAAWHFGATTMIGIFLALRERFAVAWTAWALTTAYSATVLTLIGVEPLTLVAVFAGHLGTVLVGTVFGIGIQRTSRRIAELHAAEAGYRARTARAAAVSDEQDRQTAYLEAVVAPALERIARPEPRTEAERTRWLALESAIRDSLRAPTLMVPEVDAAAAAARERGVTVTLLDDSDTAPHDAAQVRRVIAATTEALDAAGRGEVTVRVLPRGRSHLATIVARAGSEVGFTEVR